MLFNSYQFIFLFLPIVLTICYFLSARVGAAAAQDWLALASLFFYGAWNLQFLPLLLISIVFNYVVARFLLRRDEERRAPLLLAAVAVDLALLGYYKYMNFFVESAGQLFGADWTIATILLPLGISFYTFQQITLLVDVSQGRVERFRFRDFLLFVTFFPHLIAGPIVHHREMMPQFEKATYRFSVRDMSVGLALFGCGLFKKTILADGIAAYVGPLYRTAEAGQPLGLLDAWAAALGFLLQIYFDFSGYSEMALGLARMVGITLPMNFNSPLQASNIVDYWSRWHMTLTRFLTAYVYNPIAVAVTRRRAVARRRGIAGVKTTTDAFASLIAFPTVVTMFLAGLWHGAGLQFLVFGLLHGAYLVICHAFRLYRPLVWPDQASYQRIMRPVGVALTITAAAFALNFFRANSVGAAWNVASGMFGLNGVVLPQAVQAVAPPLAKALSWLGVSFGPVDAAKLLVTYTWIAGLLAIVLLLPSLLHVLRDERPALPTTTAAPLPSPIPALAELRWHPDRTWGTIVGMALGLSVLTLSNVTDFLYWQF